MRKNILLFIFLIITTVVQSQVKLGFQIAPTISTNRVNSTTEFFDIGNDGSGLRLALGPIADIQLTDNYFLSTGLLFTSKRAGFEITGDSTNNSITEEYNLQYLQIPLTMKLFTNEVALDKRVFFQFGGTFDFNIQEKSESNENQLVDDFRFFDISLLVGLGLEYQLGTSTIAYSSLSYHRGLINAIREQNVGLIGDVSVINDYFALNFGIKF